jgi:hypothetical protein
VSSVLNVLLVLLVALIASGSLRATDPEHGRQGFEIGSSGLPGSVLCDLSGCRLKIADR